MIRAESLTKHYGRIEAVNSIDFRIEKGEIIGFLGPNGAGKTTTMNMITGYLAPSDGRVYINDIDILEYPEKAKKLIGYLPEQPPLYLDLTVEEYLKFVAEFKKTPKDKRSSELDELCESMKISDMRKRLIKNLSKGYRQRVGLAQALIGNPPILILDEPTVGLDPKQIIEMREFIRKLGEDHTVVLSSHILPEISAICRRILIIDKGKIAASDSPENLSRRLSGTSRIHLLIQGDKDDVEAAISSSANVESISFNDNYEDSVADVIVESKNNADIRVEIFRKLASADLPILQMRPMDLSLEDIFLNLTTHEEVL